MSDLISRNEAYNAIIRHSQLAYRIATDEMGNDDALLDSIKFSDDFAVEVDDIAESLYACPTVDAVEVVRCRDCKHRFTHTCGMYYGTTNFTDFYLAHGADFYCAYGERKEVTHEET